ncbi:derlin-1 [Hyalella azteca]|uniref:Derlin n=1 Tax=Hyalella azteca TaxID=294128 RepID=A0A8B7NP11_HYAAZ|nr:derlin-1 [Hyalella azteca]
MGDLNQWFNSLPPMTRYWFGGTVAFSLLGRFGILQPHWLILHYDPLFYSFQIWRPVTALFFYPITPATGFHFLINLYFLYNYSLRLETGLFLGRTADYLFMLLFTWLCCVVVALMGNIMMLMDPMVMCVLYVWCQLNQETIVSFWFGTQFKAMYLPWVLLGFNLIVAGGGLMEFVGILVGHLYFFLAFKYPQDFGGASLLSTPQILYDYFPNQRGVMSGFGQAPQAPPAGGNGRGGGGGGGGGAWFRGQGHTLG